MRNNGINGGKTHTIYCDLLLGSQYSNIAEYVCVCVYSISPQYIILIGDIGETVLL